MVSIKTGKWKRYFSIPCALIDDYIKIADAAALKVILYLLSSEADENSDNDIISATGITQAEFINAVVFWKKQGIINTDIDVTNYVQTETPSTEKNVTKIIHSHLSPADISKMINVLRKV